VECRAGAAAGAAEEPAPVAAMLVVGGAAFS
jgi:hypothetical protein